MERKSTSLKILTAFLVMALVFPQQLRAENNAVLGDDRLDMLAVIAASFGEIVLIYKTPILSPVITAAGKIASRIVTPVTEMETVGGTTAGITTAAVVGSSIVLALGPIAEGGAALERAYSNFDKQADDYFTKTWAYLLNDPKLMGPLTKNSKTTYVRSVLNESTRLVVEALKKKSLNNNIDADLLASRVFISDNHTAYLQKVKDDFVINVPLTEFVYGNVVERVALDIMSVLALSDFKPKVNETASHFYEDGSVHHSYSLNFRNMAQSDAARVFAAQTLDLPVPQSKPELIEKEFKDAFAKYLQGFYERTSDFPSTLPAFEKKYLSVRTLRLPTHTGPLSGEPVLVPCRLDSDGDKAQEDLFAFTLSKCMTVHLDTVYANMYGKMRELFVKNENKDLHATNKRRWANMFWRIQANVALTILLDGAIAVPIASKIKSVGKLASLGRGAIRFAFGMGSWTATDVAMTVAFMNTKYDEKATAPHSDLTFAIEKLMTEAEFIDLTPENEEGVRKAKELGENFNQLMFNSDPKLLETVNVILQLPQVQPASH